ncbi:restriction endonuclease subunit S [Janthinobacterium sp. SUN073]|uniref:restriction endonuclease subunit S n=1 Tax=Janthinobacterium sp. SUN073 TaxID=3004102 RepID=UPI0025B1D0FE|nr:restriction endonuclease subunit S [Janthinobacterium sp. SUN073]MDN2696622.1 restriction endonuclease subunit S [Janthinobacterium sp. SUN073]
MNQIQQLLTENIGLWTGADTAKKTGRGRASGSAGTVYGVKKLRELILELAVRGKLVAQNFHDESASELLKKIRIEKARLIAEGKIKKDKAAASITEEESPFPLPHGWEWARINDFVLSIISGGTPSKNNSEFWNGEIPWASVKDLNVEKFLESTQDFITKKGLDAGSKLAEKGSLLICTRMGLGKIAIAAVDVAINQDLKALKLTSFFNVDYFVNFYRTLKITGSGMTVAGIRQDELLGYYVPTPPFAEQHRIVAKIDELMALCDQLEAGYTDAAVAHEKLVSHLLATLTASQDSVDFSAAWQRIAAHFDMLFTSEASIDALKQTLLQLAVMGRLVPQDPSDEPASALLERIQVEKARLVLEGKIKKEKPLAAIIDNEKPFSLPQGWEWVRLQSVIDLRDGTHSSPKESDGFDTYPLVTSKDFINGGINFHTAKKISKLDHFEISKRSYVEKYDILFSMIGGNIGNQVMVNDDRQFSIKNVALFKFYNKNLTFPFFIKKYTENLALNLQSTAVGGAQPFIALGILRNLVMALPSFAEQHRIVTKVDELMALCDQMKARIADASALQRKLADVIVAQAVA